MTTSGCGTMTGTCIGYPSSSKTFLPSLQASLTCFYSFLATYTFNLPPFCNNSGATTCLRRPAETGCESDIFGLDRRSLRVCYVEPAGGGRLRHALQVSTLNSARVTGQCLLLTACIGPLPLPTFCNAPPPLLQRTADMFEHPPMARAPFFVTY